MTTLGLIVDLLGFDPTRLSGRPTGYSMLYWIGLSLSLAASTALVLTTPLQRSNRWRWICAGAALMSLFGITILQHALFVEYPGQDTVAPDTGTKEVYIVPVPLPGLRSAEFDEHWSVGSPNYKNAPPAAYEAEGRKPENIAASLATVLLHWTVLMVFLVCFFAMAGLALKALIACLAELRQKR